MSRYDRDGWVEDLPRLKVGRSEHGCSQFSSGGEQVRPEQQMPRPVKVEMSMHWAPDMRHTSLVLGGEVVDVVVVVSWQMPPPPMTGMQVRPEQQGPM